MLGLLVVLTATSFASRAPTMMQLHLMESRVLDGARCLDGSAGGYYMDIPGNRTVAADPGAWHIHFEGAFERQPMYSYCAGV